MPYIPEFRDEIMAGARTPQNAGELNFQITSYLKKYLDYHKESYQTHNDIMGVLSGVSQEWYRRKVASYEDKKIAENGDVF